MLSGPIRMTRYLEAALEGGSRSQVFSDTEGTKYLVKFKENPQGTRVLVNEFIANAVAQALHAPCPRGAIIQIDQPLLDLNPTIATAVGRPISAGLHFGTKYIAGVYRRPPTGTLRQMIASVHNRTDVPAIIVLDVMTLNADRNNDGNYLIVQPDFGPSGLYLSIIDHGHCFGGPTWDLSLSAQVGAWPPSLLPELSQLITGSDPFREPLDRLKSMSDADIDSMCSSVPAEWGLSADETVSLMAFLRGQRDQMEDILQRNRQNFPNWR